MDVDLRRLEVREVVVVPLAGQDRIHAIIHVGADDRGELEIVVGAGQPLLLVEDVDQPVLVGDRRLLPLRFRQGDRHPDKVNVVELAIGVLRAEAPAALLPRLRRFAGPLAVLILVDRLQPGRAVVVRRERIALAEVRLQQRPGHLARDRVEEDRRPGAVVPLGGGGVLRILGRALPLALGHIAVPLPIPHGRVIGHDLALLVVRMARLALRRQEHLDPVLDVHHDRVGLPVGLLVPGHDLEGLAEPIDRRADQLVGADAGPQPALTIRQLAEVRHGVGVVLADLQGVVHASVAPHARDVMVRHVAVEQELARQVLRLSGAALGLEIERFGRSDDFHVHPVGLGAHDRILDGSVRRRRPELLLLGPRAAQPANGTAVRMVGVEHFRSAVHDAPLGRIAEIAARNRRRRIAESVGAVGHRLILEAEILVLQVHLVDAEGLAAIVQRAPARPIGIGQGIALRQEVALLVQRAEGLVPDLVIEDHVLAEVRSGPVVDHHLPAAPRFGRRARADRVEILRPLRLDDKGPEETQHRQLAVMTEGVELAHPLLHVRMDVPFKFLRLARLHDGIRIGRGRRLAGRAHHHAGGLNEQAPRLAFHLIAQGHLDAIALVGADRQRLDHVALESGRHGPGIEPFLVPRRLVLGLFRPDLVEVLGQDVHVARVVIEPPVQRDLDVDHRDVIVLGRRVGRTLAARQRHRLALGVRHEEEAGAVLSHVLVHHGHAVEGAGGLLGLRVGLRLLLDLLHQAVMLELHALRATRPAFDRLLDDGLALELLRPPGHRRGRRMPLVLVLLSGKQPRWGHQARCQKHRRQSHRLVDGAATALSVCIPHISASFLMKRTTTNRSTLEQPAYTRARTRPRWSVDECPSARLKLCSGLSSLTTRFSP